MKVNLFRVNQLLMCLMILGISLDAPVGSRSNETQPVVSKKFKQKLDVPSSIPDNTLTTGWFDSEPYYTLVKSEGGLKLIVDWMLNLLERLLSSSVTKLALSRLSGVNRLKI